jgi:hypothetical protein
VELLTPLPVSEVCSFDLNATINTSFHRRLVLRNAVIQRPPKPRIALRSNLRIMEARYAGAYDIFLVTGLVCCWGGAEAENSRVPRRKRNIYKPCTPSASLPCASPEPSLIPDEYVQATPQDRLRHFQRR